MAPEEELLGLVWNRFIELVSAPQINSDILWFAIPLGIATLFMTLYFGKYRREELGWNTAFGNTMVFLFVAIDLIREMYYTTPDGSWDNLFSSALYLSISGTLAIAGLLFMLVTYYHLLPKRFAFFIFSNPPVNLSLYVIMTIVYTNVAADWVTALAAFILFAMLSVILKVVQTLEGMSGQEEGITLRKEPKPGEATGLAAKFKAKSQMIRTKKEILEKTKDMFGKDEEED